MNVCVTDLHEELSQIVEFKHGDRVKEYRVSKSGTHYGIGTLPQLASILDDYIANRNCGRLLILYGDNNERKLWGDADRCYIGRSTGSCKIPLVIPNSRSIGGSSLLDECIVALYHTTQPYNRVWTHPNWDASVLRAEFLKLKQSGELYIRG